MAIGIEITLDPGNVVSGANQVDKALDGIGNSADNVQNKTNSMGDAILAALSKQQKATQQMLANAQATKAVAQEQSRLLASQSSLNSSSAQSEARQKEYQRLSAEIK
jgi:type IV secretory pathway TrbL component